LQLIDRGFLISINPKTLQSNKKSRRQSMKNNNGNSGRNQLCLCIHNECVLCSDGLLDGLPIERYCQAEGAVRKASYQPQDVLFREGEPVTHLFELRYGNAKLTTSLPDGREQILRIGVPGHLLGFESLEHDVYGYTAQALGTVETCAIHKQDIQHVIAENPGVIRRIAKRLTEELEQAEDMIRILGLKKSDERVASFLLSLVTDQTDLNKNLSLYLGRSEIAKLLGMTTETVSRVMTKLQREAVIIAPRGSVRILDHNRLRSMSGVSLSGN
jgi:CRP/FNR family transcriptional regulator